MNRRPGIVPSIGESIGEKRYLTLLKGEANEVCERDKRNEAEATPRILMPNRRMCHDC